MELLILCGTAAALAVGHTIVGVDHTLPFILVARASHWSLARLWTVTAACGLAHVAGTVLIASAGVALGEALEGLLAIEAARGSLAAWLLVAFGFGYAALACARTLRGRKHEHEHTHGDGTMHAHEHGHGGQHAHVHAARASLPALALFVLFVFGPCEFMVAPLVAAGAFGWPAVALVSVVFGAVTIATMLALVTVGHLGLARFRAAWVERHVHTLAGLGIAAAGLAIVVLGV